LQAPFLGPLSENLSASPTTPSPKAAGPHQAILGFATLNYFPRKGHGLAQKARQDYQETSRTLSKQSSKEVPLSPGGTGFAKLVAIQKRPPGPRRFAPGIAKQTPPHADERTLIEEAYEVLDAPGKGGDDEKILPKRLGDPPAFQVHLSFPDCFGTQDVFFGIRRHSPRCTEKMIPAPPPTVFGENKKRAKRPSAGSAEKKTGNKNQKHKERPVPKENRYHPLDRKAESALGRRTPRPFPATPRKALRLTKKARSPPASIGMITAGIIDKNARRDGRESSTH